MRVKKEELSSYQTATCWRRGGGISLNIYFSNLPAMRDVYACMSNLYLFMIVRIDSCLFSPLFGFITTWIYFCLKKRAWWISHNWRLIMFDMTPSFNHGSCPLMQIIFPTNIDKVCAMFRVRKTIHWCLWSLEDTVWYFFSVLIFRWSENNCIKYIDELWGTSSMVGEIQINNEYMNTSGFRCCIMLFSIT